MDRCTVSQEIGKLMYYCIAKKKEVNVFLFHLLSEIQCPVFAASLLVRIFYLVMSRLIEGQIFPE